MTTQLQALCGLLGMSASGYADWKECGGPAQWLSGDQLLALIRSVHASQSKRIDRRASLES